VLRNHLLDFPEAKTCLEHLAHLTQHPRFYISLLEFLHLHLQFLAEPLKIGGPFLDPPFQIVAGCLQSFLGLLDL